MKKVSRRLELKVDVQMPSELKRSQQNELIPILKLLVLAVLLLVVLVIFLVGASSFVDFILRLAL